VRSTKPWSLSKVECEVVADGPKPSRVVPGKCCAAVDTVANMCQNGSDVMRGDVVRVLSWWGNGIVL